MERPKEKTNTTPLLGDFEIAQNCSKLLNFYWWLFSGTKSCRDYLFGVCTS